MAGAHHRRALRCRRCVPTGDDGVPARMARTGRQHSPAGAGVGAPVGALSAAFSGKRSRASSRTFRSRPLTLLRWREMVLAALSLLVLLAVVIKALRYNPALTLLVLAAARA